jgi:5-methylcytosine-specific restriction enzyme B
MAADLATDVGLRDACKTALDGYQMQVNHKDWLSSLSTYLHHIRDAGEREFLSESVQRELWESEAISATGSGRVNVSKVIKNHEVARELWSLKSTRLPEGPSLRTRSLARAWDEIIRLVEPLVERTPRLKMYRVFAALHPTEFTTVTHSRKLRQLGQAMAVNKDLGHPLELHKRILSRLEEVLGPAGPELSLLQLERMTLPWALYATHVQEKGDDATLVAGSTPGDESLKPLPADRRRRGLLAIAGSLSSILAMIEFAKDGCKREDFREHVRSINPKLAPGSVGTNINALIAEWGVLRADGDDLGLTPRGEALLETGEAEEVADWLLTRILGFDNLLYMLNMSPRSSKELIAELQKVNPGWTSIFAPTAMINWARGMGLVESDISKTLRLTEQGRDWAARIHWVPGVLEAGSQPANTANADDLLPTNNQALARPSLDRIIKSFPAGIQFESQVIARLDAGLWANRRRHFAVLTGLSGAGKTQLARGYALGLWVDQPDPKQGLYIVPVQPGWHDPASLLGYVNPLENEVYIRTGFLDFLLQANSDPDQPYTVVLDEMNLSHPEQYLAPLLSAMETGAEVELHNQGSEIAGVPARIPYPENLFLIGTVNMDETTHGLSDKVLDRASVIEFWNIDVDKYPRWDNAAFSPQQVDTLRATLRELAAALRPVRLHFGWRTIDDVIGFVSSALAGGVINFHEALDHAIYSKVLPKLRGEGTSRMLEALTSAQEILRLGALRDSERKLLELIEDLRLTGSARFWR